MGRVFRKVEILFFVGSFILGIGVSQAESLPRGEGSRLGNGEEAVFEIRFQKIEREEGKAKAHVFHVSKNEAMSLALQNPKNNTYLIDESGAVYPFEKAEHISVEHSQRTRFHPGVGRKYILTFAPLNEEAKELHLVVMYYGGDESRCCFEYEAVIRNIALE